MTAWRYRAPPVVSASLLSRDAPGFRYLAEGGIWFDDDSAPAHDGQDASIAV